MPLLKTQQPVPRLSLSEIHPFLQWDTGIGRWSAPSWSCFGTSPGCLARFPQMLQWALCGAAVFSTLFPQTVSEPVAQLNPPFHNHHLDSVVIKNNTIRSRWCLLIGLWKETPVAETLPGSLGELIATWCKREAGRNTSSLMMWCPGKLELCSSYFTAVFFLFQKLLLQNYWLPFLTVAITFYLCMCTFERAMLSVEWVRKVFEMEMFENHVFPVVNWISLGFRNKMEIKNHNFLLFEWEKKTNNCTY